MKRQVTWLLSVVLLVSLGLSAMAAEQVTLQFMGWEASPLETKSVQDGLAQFMKENPHIKVEYTPVAGDYDAKLLTMMAGNAAPDVFFCRCATYRDFQKRGGLLDLTEYVDQSMSVEEFIPMSREKMTIDGRVYGLSSCNTVAVMFYNKDIFDEAGLPYPPSDPKEAWTWAEFVDVARKLTIVQQGRTVQYGAYGFTTNWFWSDPLMVLSNNGQLLNEDYTELLLDSPEAKEALVKVRELQQEGVLPLATTLEQTGMSAAQMLQTGRIAMLVDGSWALQELAAMDFPVGIGVLPVMEEPITVGQAHLHSVTSKTKYPDEAWKLVEFLSSRGYQTNVVRSGLWLPNRVDMYEKENLGVWMNPEVYPEGFEDMLEYFTVYEVLWPAVMVPAEALDIIIEEFDNFFLAGQPIDEVMSRLKGRVDPILQRQ